MTPRSAGILLFKYEQGDLRLLLVHPGGPFWARKDEGAWSIPKGLFGEDERAIDAAKREFKEETGFDAAGEFIALGSIRQPNRKIVYAWAVEQDLDVSKIVSNMFPLEWPKNSGRIREFPEIDRGQWFAVVEARRRIQKGQEEFIDILLEKLQDRCSRPNPPSVESQ
ncbi:MAG: NUDIX domain-containing protein [Gammaproteobacteria bacterium]